MNFLAHYHIDYPCQDPNYVCGLILPDLTRISHPKSRLTIDSTVSAIHSHDKAHASLAQGVWKHMEVDAVWHNAEVFHSLQKEIKTALINEEVLGLDRPSFLAHISMELVLDRILLHHHPELGEELYDKLEEVNVHDLKDFLKESGFSGLMLSRFFSFFQHFKEDRYACQYMDDAVLVEILSHIYFRGTRKKIALGTGAWLYKAEQAIEIELDAIFKLFEGVKVC